MFTKINDFTVPVHVLYETFHVDNTNCINV